MKDATLLTGSTNIYLCHSPARYNRRCTLRLLELEALLPRDPQGCLSSHDAAGVGHRRRHLQPHHLLVRDEPSEAARPHVHAGETVFGYSKYREWLKHWGRTLFDCFRRGSRIMVRIDGELVETTCAQLNFFFVWHYGYIDRCRQCLGAVRDTQRAGAKRKRSKSDRRMLTHSEDRHAVCAAGPVLTRFIQPPSTP